MMPQETRKTRVLVFPCGAENGSEVYRSLRYSVHTEMYGASSVDDHGRFLFPNYRGDLPNIASTAFIPRFRDLIENWKIDIVFPTHDSVCEFLGANATSLDCHVVNADANATRVARSKRLSYELFSDQDWIPSIYARPESVEAWPAVVKPDRGQGGQGVRLVSNAGDAADAMSDTESPLLMEHLPGPELTIDCFTDRKGQLVFVGPRTRERIRAGISMRSCVMDEDPQVIAIASEINRRMRMRGPWFFQAKRSRTGRWKLLEISCRISSSMAAQRARGVNLPLLAVLDWMDRDVIALPVPCVRMIDRNIATCAEVAYDFDDVFIDLDDTLVIDGSPVAEALAFVYRMLNSGKRIVLITRHTHDIGQTLSRARVAPNLFDEIVHIKDARPKADFVTPRSIFVDNHFPERLMVAQRSAVPVFDVDALEMLK